MGKKDNEPSDGMEKLFSTQGILIAILILGLYWVFFGEDNIFAPSKGAWLTMMEDELNLVHLDLNSTHSNFSKNAFFST